MEKDLHISDQQYLIALTLFFFPYALFEVSLRYKRPWMSFVPNMQPAGAVQCIPEEAPPVSMVVVADVLVGNHDGKPLYNRDQFGHLLTKQCTDRARAGT